MHKISSEKIIDQRSILLENIKDKVLKYYHTYGWLVIPVITSEKETFPDINVLKIDSFETIIKIVNSDYFSRLLQNAAISVSLAVHCGKISDLTVIEIHNLYSFKIFCEKTGINFETLIKNCGFITGKLSNDYLSKTYSHKLFLFFKYHQIDLVELPPDSGFLLKTDGNFSTIEEFGKYRIGTEDVTIFFHEVLKNEKPTPFPQEILTNFRNSHNHHLYHITSNNINYTNHENNHENKKTKEIVREKTIRLKEIYFYENDGMIYDRNGEPVGPSVKVTGIVKNARKGPEREKVYYLLEYENKKFIIPGDFDKKDVEAYTERKIVSFKLFTKYFNQQISPFTRRLIRYDATGWYETQFKHPALSGENEIWDEKNEDFIEILNTPAPDKETRRKMHEFVINQLKEGTLFSLIYLAGISSLFLNLTIDGTKILPFSIFITGLSEKGKSLAGKIVQNTFLPFTIEKTARITANALELTISSLKNLPLLFDEVRIATFNEEEIIFMLASGSGKGRANKYLEVHTNKLSSVAIFTGEYSIEIKRAGAIRRFLEVFILNETQLFNENPYHIYKNYGTLWGWGLDYIKFLNANFEKIKKYFQEVTDPPEDLIPFFTIYLALNISLNFLEDFYNTKFPYLREKIISLIRTQTEEFKEKINEESMFFSFREFIFRHRNKFVTTKRNTFNRDEHWGIIEKKSEGHYEVYIITDALKTFFSNYHINRKVFLELARKKGILASKNDYGEVRRFKNTPSLRLYKFKLCDNDTFS